MKSLVRGFDVVPHAVPQGRRPQHFDTRTQAENYETRLFLLLVKKVAPAPVQCGRGAAKRTLPLN